MRRNGILVSVVASLGFAAIVAGCSDSAPSEALDDSQDTPAVLVSGQLAGGGWNPAVEQAAQNGKIAVCHSGSGKNFQQLNLPPTGARAHLGDPATGRGGHQYDFRVSDNTPCPPPAQVAGLVRVCKVAGSGVTAGTSFTFVLTSDGQQKTVTVAAGAAPTGTCADGGTFAVGSTVTVQENQQTGVTTSAITVAPMGAQQGTPDLANRSATVVTGSNTTTVTFTNTTGNGGATGTLVICKVGGTGVTAGTNFTFTAGTQTATVAAGAAPNGTCGSPITLPAGTVAVTETGSAGVIVQAIAGSPTPTSVSLPGRSASTLITAGQESRITFTNVASTAANSGSLVLCKVGGAGVTAGTNFTFNVAGQTSTVAAGAAPTGTCITTPIAIAAGNVTITENATTGVGVTAVTATGAGGANALVSSDLPTRSATVTMTAGQTTTVTYTNAAP